MYTPKWSFLLVVHVLLFSLTLAKSTYISITTYNVSTNSSANTSLLAPNEKNHKKPTFKPVSSRPIKKPTYKYPSHRPQVPKHPTSKPTAVHKYPSKFPTHTKKPAYSYPSKRPGYVSPNSISSRVPSFTPTKPTVNPSIRPTLKPSVHPTRVPTKKPTSIPTFNPSSSHKPTMKPTLMPSLSPTRSHNPTLKPTYSQQPSKYPSKSPTAVPITHVPTASPSFQPTHPVGNSFTTAQVLSNVTTVSFNSANGTFVLKLAILKALNNSAVTSIDQIVILNITNKPNSKGITTKYRVFFNSNTPLAVYQRLTTSLTTSVSDGTFVMSIP